MWSKQPRSSARKSRFVDIIMGGFWLRSMQLNYSTASPAEEMAFWILPKRILLKTEKCLNFINHQSIAVIRIFFVFSWNPSYSIYVFASFESSTYFWFWAQDMCDAMLKYGSQEKIPFCCRCSILLGPTFVEIKKSFTETLLTFNSKNFRIICYWKKSDKSVAIYCFKALKSFFLKHFIIVWYA